MPIYEYQCTSCHHAFDVMQKMNDPLIKTCPTCTKDTVKRLMSAGGFQLKGTGWYVTDFKDKGKPKPKSETTTTTTTNEAAATPAKTTETKGETK